MSQETTYKSCGIPDEILDGIFPIDMTQPELKLPETEKEKNEEPCKITGDGKYPKMQTDEKKPKQNYISSTHWIFYKY